MNEYGEDRCVSRLDELVELVFDVGDHPGTDLSPMELDLAEEDRSLGGLDKVVDLAALATGRGSLKEWAVLRDLPGGQTALLPHEMTVLENQVLEL